MTECSGTYAGREGRHFGLDRDPRTTAANDWNKEYGGQSPGYEKTSEAREASRDAESEFGIDDENPLRSDGGEPTMADVDHTPRNGEGVQHVYQRGTEK
ncbi:hypothetical protein [Candidatus Nanohalococcus occultus]|uniref:hypothetical protein n=1 Tax=Candidatus Nanohalococcus occultus TaxID=2978047 RepID=UPI0039DF2E77